MKDLAKTEHIALLYETPEESLKFLANYYNEGLAANELCVFVSLTTPPEMAIKALSEAGLKNIYDHVENHNLLVYSALDTYLTNGEFVASYMLGNVESFLEDAERQGYNGLRTAGEMNWLADHPEYHDHVARYESDVNGVAGKIKFTGLCLYSSQQLADRVIHTALRTHPNVVINNRQQVNPYYSVA